MFAIPDWTPMLYGGALNFACIFIFWLLYVRSKNPGVIDIYWSLGILLMGLVFAQLSPEELTLPRIIALGLLIGWSGRLAGFLTAARIMKGEKDARYLELSANQGAGVNVKFLLNYLVQGFLQLLISLTLLVLFFGTRSADSWFFIGVALTLIGIIGESVADIQLNRFIRQGNRGDGKVLQTGLWAYSRHPNYFFEFLVWLGFALQAFSVSGMFLAVAAPVIMLIIFYGITMPVTERHMRTSRGAAFADYCRKVSRFIPLPPKS